jgi:hypothetical protein
MERPFSKKDGRDTAKEVERRLLHPEEYIQVTIVNEEKILINFPPKSFSILKDIARKRNLSIEETVGEALRFEQLFADCTDNPEMALIYKKGHRRMILSSV